MFFDPSRSSYCRFHPATAVFLLLTAGLLSWANLRETGWQRELGDLEPPAGLDPITQRMFYRGWPLSPFMVCMFHGMKWHPEEGRVHMALALDAIIFVVVLFAVGAICERLFRRRKNEVIEQ
jgi:hypothetical protein